MILLCFCLRAYKLNSVFTNMDEVYQPLYLLDSFPSEGLKSLTMVENKAAGNPLRLLANPASALEVILIFIIVSFFNFVGIPFTEFFWVLPKVAVGASCPFVTYLLVKDITKNSWAALMAATLIGVLPIHVMMSRVLGPPVVEGFILQVLIIRGFIKYFENSDGTNVLVISILLTLYIITEAQFPAIFIVIDYTLSDRHPGNVGRLHVLFRCENPTTLKKDFELLPKRTGKGRFVGSIIGARPLTSYW